MSNQDKYEPARGGFGDLERIRPSIRALIDRGNITLEEIKTIRCNPLEWQAMVPAMNDEAFCERMQYALDNCFTPRPPHTTYNQAVEGLYAPELIRRFRSVVGSLRLAEETYKEILGILRLLLPMLPDNVKPHIEDVLKEG